MRDMQISAPTPAQQLARPTGPKLGNLLYVGVKHAHDQPNDFHEREEVRLYRSERAGSATGYSSLDNAIKAATFITSEYELGSTAVAAVREGERFMLYRVRERFEHPVNGFRTPGTRAEFEGDGDGEIVIRAEQPYYEHASLRALIDGAHVQRFLPGAVEPGVRPR
jgi:hypothetical protein